MTDEDAIRRQIDAIRPEDGAPSEDPLERRTRELADGPQRISLDLPEPPTAEEIAARLGPMKERLELSHGQALPDEATAEANRGLAIGMQVAYLLVGVPLGGWACGWLLDHALGTSGIWQSALLILGAVAGLVLAMRTLARTDRAR